MPPSLDIPRHIRSHHAGKLKLDEFITDRIDLVDINQAIKRIRQGEVVGRCLVRMGS